MTEKVTSKRVTGVTTMACKSEKYYHSVVPTEIPATPYGNDNMSTLTGVIGYPTIPRRELIEDKIGLPATPSQNSTLFTNESIIDVGYDSSRYLGPPHNAPGL